MDKRLLREFNDKLIMGRKLSAMMRKKNVETVEDEVLAKVDLIVEKTQVVLDMFPEKIHITLVLLADDDEWGTCTCRNMVSARKILPTILYLKRLSTYQLMTPICG